MTAVHQSPHADTACCAALPPARPVNSSIHTNRRAGTSKYRGPQPPETPPEAHRCRALAQLVTSTRPAASPPPDAPSFPCWCTPTPPGQTFPSRRPLTRAAPPYPSCIHPPLCTHPPPRRPSEVGPLRLLLSSLGPSLPCLVPSRSNRFITQLYIVTSIIRRRQTSRPLSLFFLSLHLASYFARAGLVFGPFRTNPGSSLIAPHHTRSSSGSGPAPP